ncbi:SRPBCC family protein [Flavivirga eckloniae]|uniref:Uncharacterized protein n=1 Tax=Flavivirga eckloniae TaxID=1803846 RepID=A0A2K9PRT7_9FLAO|nr:SRPBCC family protein [Flavivirga eckloniae]AUP79781.1 hypothetical protein C1H87_14135 [Flavivirga eckloniae]
MKQLLIVPAILIMIGCNGQNKAKLNSTAEPKMIAVYPSADKFVKTPLRNSITLKLNAPPSKVWSQVGRLERMPEYSSGLEKVDAEYDTSNKCTSFTCHFLPMEERQQGLDHSEKVVWYEPNIGLASLAHEPNAFDLQQSLGLITLKAEGDHTIFKWAIHFTSKNDEAIAMNIAAFKQALNDDIAQNLIKIFGGEVLENFSQDIQ